MVPSRVSVGLPQSSSSSGVYYQGDAQSQTGVSSHLSPSFGYSSNSVPGTAASYQGATSGDMNGAALNSMGNSGPSVGASSLVTDANSALSGGPHLQRSASINTESYMRLPASPMSFTSNNISISGSSVIDGSSVVQQGSHQDQTAQQLQQFQQEQGNSSVTSLSPSQAGQMLLPMGPRVPGSFIQNPNNLAHVQKKPRIDMKQEDFIQQQVLQQLLQRPDPMLQNRNPQLQALLQQQRLRQQQQQILQSMPHLQRAQMQQQQQLQLRQQLQQQGMQPMNMKRPYDSGVCARRLMQYLYHQRQRPPDNAIAYWRKFVTEYYSPNAKKRWCLSLYENVGQHALGVFPQAAVDAWHCDICGSKSGRGFEATFEVLPRLNEIKFGSGVIDELLFLDLPKEYRLPTGIMVLEYGKAVQESVYEQLRVVREGQLRIRFSHDLKILSWEFCALRHEELLPRRLVAPQVHQLVQVVQKCQSTITESGAEGVSSQDLQNNSNMVLSAGRQLAKTLELQSLNDLGFSKRYVRCLQISEVVNSMKDLIDFCKETNTGPIEGLKNFPRHASAAKLQMQKLQEMEQLANVQGLATDRNTLSKLMALQHSGLNNQLSHPNLAHRGALSGSPQSALALTTGYQNLLMRQNSMNSNSSSLQQEASSLSNSVQSPTGAFPAPKLLHSSGYSSPNLPSQQQALNSPTGMLLQNPSQSQGSQTLQQQMIQHLLQEMSNNNGGGGGIQQAQLRNGMGFGNNHQALPQGQGQAQAQAQAQAQSKMQAQLQVQPASSNVSGQATSRSNSFKGTAGSNSDSCAPPAAGNNGCNPEKAPDMPQGLHLSDDIVSDIAREFTDNGFFGGDMDDTMGFEWKALQD